MPDLTSRAPRQMPDMPDPQNPAESVAPTGFGGAMDLGTTEAETLERAPGAGLVRARCLCVRSPFDRR